MKTNPHQNPMETGHRKEDPSLPPTERSFGLVFIGFFCLVEGILFWKRGVLALWPLGGALVLATALLVFPAALRPLNLLWFRFGLLLHMVISPLVLGLLFYGVITPVGFLMRLTGRDPMAREWKPQAESYWISRKTGKDPLPSMKNPF